MISAYAQQAKTDAVSVKNKTAAKGVDPNIERTRIVNEKIATDKAAAAQRSNTKHNIAPQHMPMQGKVPTSNGNSIKPQVMSKAQPATGKTETRTGGFKPAPATASAPQSSGKSIQQQREEGQARSMQMKRENAQQHKAAPRVNNTKVTAKGPMAGSTSKPSTPTTK